MLHVMFNLQHSNSHGRVSRCVCVLLFVCVVCLCVVVGVGVSFSLSITYSVCYMGDVYYMYIM